MVVDSELRVQVMNGAAERLLNLSFDEVAGRPLTKMLGDHELVRKLQDVCGKSLEQERFDFQPPAVDGRPAQVVQVRLAAISSQKEGACGMIAMMDDVTREREMNRMKSEFISTAAHELRTPLTSIQGFSEVLLESGSLDGEEPTQFLGYIHEQAQALSGIVDDLLDISRIESGRTLVLRREICRVGKCLEKVVAPMLDGSSGHHDFDMQLQGGEAELEVDPEKIRQVMDNLLSNAVKYSPDGGLIRISGRLEQGQYRVSIEDRGIGMTPEQLERVFDKFYRADGSNTAIGGIGLGMSIVKHIIEAHGGSIRVDSDFGRGTTVAFSLPLASG